MNNRMTNEFTEVSFNTSRNERPQYRNFSASKLSNSVKPNSMVEFTDFMGRKHLVQCRNNSEVIRQMKFFGMLKRESTTINQIIAQYPITLGKVEKKFLKELKNDLKLIGLNKRAIEIVLG